MGDVLAQSLALRAPDRISWHDWREVVGSKIAHRSRAEKIEDGVLWITVTSATWAQELSMLQRTIIGRLSGKGPKISKLRFTVGRVEPLRSGVARELPTPVQLPPELAATLNGLEDPLLRKVIAEAASYQLAINQGPKER